MLLALIPLWFWGWRFFYRLSFVKILLFPITWYNNRMIRKYGENTPRIILKNMGAAKSKPNMEEIIEQRLKESAKPGKRKPEKSVVRFRRKYPPPKRNSGRTECCVNNLLNTF